MPFHVQAKNTKTGETQRRDLGERHDHSLTTARHRSDLLAAELGTDWVADPEYYAMEDWLADKPHLDHNHPDSVPLRTPPRA